jgi:hypothetical protein
MRLPALFAALFLLLATHQTLAQEHRAQPLDEAPPADAISADIAKALNPKGVRVVRGEDRAVVDLWLAKEWNVKSDFKASTSVLYPFEVGTLIGVARFKNRGNDFRDQEIPAGVYTIRYAQQPVDGNHVGTSDTRDFLVLLPAGEDQSVAPMAEMAMIELSPKVTGGTHPAMMALLRSGKAESAPTIHHDAERELWSVRQQGNAKAGGKTQPLPIEIVVVGHAEA